MKPKIAFFDTKPYDKVFFDELNKNYGYGFKYFQPRLTEDTAGLAKGFDAVCVFVNDDINRKVVESLAQDGIKIIALRCAGYNNVDFKSAYEHIHVVNVPAYSPYAVAEHALTLILALNRKIHRAYARTKDLNFNINGLLGFDMHGRTIGIIGTGRIGKVFAKVMSGFGMKVLAYDMFQDKKAEADLGFSYVSLDALISESDIISLHCPLTKETQNMINEESISKMKDGVFIVNTSRGKLIDTKALIAGLKTGKIGGAGLDVYEEESSYFFEDFSSSIIEDDVLARLLTFPNVIITSHQGYFTKEALTNIALTTMENIDDYFSGRFLKNEICYRCKNYECNKEEKEKCF
jgi:D-lactate dehydrogenase